MIPEGGSAKLVCKARGYPPPTITWRREDGGEIIIRLPVTGQKSKGKYDGSYFEGVRDLGMDLSFCNLTLS